MKNFILFFLFCSFQYAFSQNVYKTPSGKKYHLSSCRMVQNVSKKLLGKDATVKYKLTSCKICKPPLRNFKVVSNKTNKSVGKSTKSVQCKGMTKKGKRCQHKTKLGNGYCYQHTPKKTI
mgnify:CR=1 FL=1|tara:strand:+ start:128 stop:487 length:360 start_codon:yes stop_codon:yes gene_type:complete